MTLFKKTKHVKEKKIYAKIKSRNEEKKDEGRRQMVKTLTEEENSAASLLCFFWKSPWRGAVQIPVRPKENNPLNNTDNISEAIVI